MDEGEKQRGTNTKSINVEEEWFSTSRRKNSGIE